MNFKNYILYESYSRVQSLGNRLGEVKDLIDWTQFIPLVSPLYYDNSITGGRPHTDEVLLVKMCVLQQWHNLSDPALERECTDRISFRHFLDYPDKVPNSYRTYAKLHVCRSQCLIKPLHLSFFS